jgi:NDP-sugar pyrophosphorylase family protein
MKIVLVVGPEGQLLGTVTDGDIRRGILKNIGLSEPIERLMNRNPLTCGTHQSREEILCLMKERLLFQIPVLDAKGRVERVEILEDLIKQVKRKNPVVLMAGGKGTRLYPLTETCPKPLLKVGDKPILERIIEEFARQGFETFYISVNYKAQMITDYFGDGSRWNIKIQYLHETRELGTAGALSLLPVIPTLPLILMNGDLLTQVDFQKLLDFHEENQAEATMCIKHYEFQVPYGVVQVSDHQLIGLDEKPVHRFFVNAGIYVLNPSTLANIPADEHCNITDLFKTLSEKNIPASVFPIRESWMDIGRLDDFEKANTEHADSGPESKS